MYLVYNSLFVNDKSNYPHTYVHIQAFTITNIPFHSKNFSQIF